MTTDRKATPERARKAPKAPARSGELGKVLPVVRRREKPRKRGGRPSIIEPAVVEAIVRTVRLGNYRDTAAVYAGIGKRTLYTWLARGRAEREVDLARQLIAVPVEHEID